MTNVDLSQLAIDRGREERTALRGRRHVLTRYVLPAALLCGFAALAVWAAWDFVFPPRPVKVVPVLATQAEMRREGAALFQAAGWIEPRPTPIRVAALAPGIVEQLLVVEDQAVAAGEPVAELVKDDAQLAYERAQADLKLREAEIVQAQAALAAAETRFKQPVHLEAALGEAEAALAKLATQLANLPFETDRAQAQLEFAKSDYEGKLAAKGAVSGRDVERAKSELDTAQALLNELERRQASLTKEHAALVQRRDALQTQLELLADETKARDESQALLSAAAARVEQGRVAVAEAKLRLDRMTVRAPVAGRIYQLVADPGAALMPGPGRMETADASTVVTMYRPDSLQVRVDVRFEDIPKVQLGQPVRIDNPALHEPLVGSVLFVGSEADIQKNTLEVKVGIDAPPAVFKPEMLVDATFLAPKPTGEAAETSPELRLFVPENLVRRDEGAAFVWLADQSAGVARKTPVETGQVADDGLIEIVRGLSLTSRLISSDVTGLDDGERIVVTGEESAHGGAAAPSSGGSRSLPSRFPSGASGEHN